MSVALLVRFDLIFALILLHKKAFACIVGSDPCAVIAILRKTVVSRAVRSRCVSELV